MNEIPHVVYSKSALCVMVNSWADRHNVSSLIRLDSIADHDDSVATEADTDFENIVGVDVPNRIVLHTPLKH